MVISVVTVPFGQICPEYVISPPSSSRPRPLTCIPRSPFSWSVERCFWGRALIRSICHMTLARKLSSSRTGSTAGGLHSGSLGAGDLVSFPFALPSPVLCRGPYVFSLLGASVPSSQALSGPCTSGRRTRQAPRGASVDRDSARRCKGYGRPGGGMAAGVRRGARPGRARTGDPGAYGPGRPAGGSLPGRPDTTGDDLRQTGPVALIAAVDRYDPDRGIPFVPFAIATVIGQLKGHLRDATWQLGVPPYGQGERPAAGGGARRGPARLRRLAADAGDGPPRRPRRAPP
jgi:Sigma-70 region 2